MAIGVPRVLLASRLEGERCVDEIEIEIVELEFLEACLEGRLNALRTMICIPELGCDKALLSLDLPPREDFFHRFANLFFSPVTFRGVEGTESRLKRGL